MKTTREKAAQHLIHCHGCGKGVIVQFTSQCHLCGAANTTLQTIHDGACHACGEDVSEYTPSAAAQLRLEMERDERRD